MNLTEVKNYNPSKPLVMVTHGWLGSGYSNGTQLIKDAYLATRDVNVIIVDWKEPASYTNYITSAYLTDSVAEEVSCLERYLYFDSFLFYHYQILIGKDIFYV